MTPQATGSSCWVRPALTALSVALCMVTAPAKAGQALQNARDYVLAACIVNAYAGQPLAKEGEIWAQGLVEAGDLPAASYKALAELAKKAPPPQSSMHGTPMLLQNCVDWSNHAKLKSEVQKILASRRRK